MPTDRDALLAAICAAPDDDTPRLVFADWLDENGASNWAALIRTECELARLADDGSGAEAVFRFLRDWEPQSLQDAKWSAIDPEIARRVELWKAAKKLRPKVRRELATLIPRDTGLWWLNDTHRGFPATLCSTSKSKVDSAAITQLPACGMRFGYATEEPVGAVRQWVADGLLRHVRELTMLATRADLMPEFSTCADVAGVRSFSLSGQGGGGEMIVRWLCGCGHNWRGLRELEISCDAGLSREPAALLLRAEHIQKLTQLRISGNDWTRRTVAWTRHTIAALSEFTELRELRLSYWGLRDDAAEALAKMPGLTSLRSLVLEGNQITGRGATALLTSPHLANLARLSLTANPARNLDRKALAKVSHGSLRVLQCRDCQFSVNDVAALADSPRLSNLIYLDLAWNRLPEAAAARLVRGFGDRAPAILHLGANEFGQKAAQTLADWPAMRCVQVLNLTANRLDATVAKILARSPHFTSIRRICAGGLAAAGQKALKERFGKKADV
jgi:uncharacterized protein (TIGR02996 family)